MSQRSIFRKEIFLTAVERETDNAGALAWLDHALKYARNRRQRRLEDLLESVRADILFEIELTAGILDARLPTNRERNSGRKDRLTNPTNYKERSAESLLREILYQVCNALTHGPLVLRGLSASVVGNTL
jgi:hypothetical protein